LTLAACGGSSAGTPAQPQNTPASSAAPSPVLRRAAPPLPVAETPKAGTAPKLLQPPRPPPPRLARRWWRPQRTAYLQSALETPLSRSTARRCPCPYNLKELRHAGVPADESRSETNWAPGISSRRTSTWTKMRIICSFRPTTTAVILPSTSPKQRLRRSP
jgi:hypothetical protein